MTVRFAFVLADFVFEGLLCALLLLFPFVDKLSALVTGYRLVRDGHDARLGHHD